MFTKENIKQFISYFFVGGVAAVVEWIMFYLFANVVHVQYMLATVLAFVFSTTTNWYLGKKTTFKNNTTYSGKQLKEVILIFVVSGIGLLLNLILMYVFIECFKLNTSMMKLFAKILATGIVFVWNFLIRKFIIYK